MIAELVNKAIVMLGGECLCMLINFIIMYADHMYVCAAVVEDERRYSVSNYHVPVVCFITSSCALPGTYTI